MTATDRIALPHIAFELTNRCNLDCIYCYNIWKMTGAKHVAFNSYQKATKALDEVFRQANILSVALTGGEPLLAERFLEVALFCRMAGKQVTVISNGVRKAETTYQQLLKMGVGLFEFPIHSAQASIHDKMVGYAGSWEQSVASVKQILQLGGYVVPVVVITRFNVGVLGETLDFINSLNCKRIMLNRYNIGGSGCERPQEISASPNELRSAFALADHKATELELRLSSNVCSPMCLLHPRDYPNIAFGHCSFDATLRPVTLDVNGNVRLCNHSPVVAGNIFEQPLWEILNGDYAQLWASSIPTFCSECVEWQQCKGGCRAASEQCQLGLTHEDPILQL
ncbi:MAG: radical SAM protein [Prevotellaceae bacterium]|jgi:radical SAM protein with 4Fe4S-binding SPASM domain|nr:radical SAM protein [Prevotellaceae bacterium]